MNNEFLRTPVLKPVFLKTVNEYLPSGDHRAGALWHEIVKHYSAAERFYHDLSHLENILAALSGVERLIEEPAAVVFSVFYHDIIYDVSANDNEEKSSELAAARLREISVPENVVSRCCGHILSTKFHSNCKDPDTGLFIDADLSVLGSEPSVYSIYSSNIRKEYSKYPEPEYVRGRLRVLKQFMDMAAIFKTSFFYDKYEKQARKNILCELDSLALKI